LQTQAVTDSNSKLAVNQQQPSAQGAEGFKEKKVNPSVQEQSPQKVSIGNNLAISSNDDERK